ncbi:MAG: UvrD-helicase domain-containing protein [Alloprevotella sp.]|nr:UvrD-helicase domain-containing protein [Alloprevotella sp.]
MTGETERRIESELNAAQWEAVSYCDGPSLVIAGAGSGKTRVLTYKIAYLLQRGLAPWQILALTFTNKAAREMVSRISTLIEREEGLKGRGLTRDLWAGTFHSIFARILRIEAEAVGYTRDFTIYDTADARSLIKTIVKEMGLDDKAYKPATVAARISEAKNRLVLPDAYLSSADLRKRDERDGIGATGRIYEAYVRRCHQANAMDFDDLLLYTFLLLNGNEEIRLKYQQRFGYILVDEYQDTNYAQYRIIRLLAPPEGRLCVVGDDAQRIYGFRGADIGNILSFQTDYPSTRLIKLEQNYRSTQRIVNAANSIIAHNAGRIPKTVFSELAEGDRLLLLSAYSDREESMKIVRHVHRLVRSKNLDYNQIAVLYRTNAQSRTFEDSFRSADIPYRIYGGQSFYQRKEIKDIIAYLRLTANPRDEEALLRVINYPVRGIGQTTVQKLQGAAAKALVPLWDVVCRPGDFGVQINRGTQGKLAGFVRLIEDFRTRMPETGAYDLASAVVRETGIAADLAQDNSPENISRRENVEELLNGIRDFEKDELEEQGKEIALLTDYLPRVALLTDQDQRETGEPRVTLMTIHAAKGLEFSAVFVTGLEAGLFPNATARYSPREMEEERRLFYVAVTRAKEYCFLSYAKQRYKYGQMEFCEPSPFIDEIDGRYLEEEAATPFRNEEFPRTKREPPCGRGGLTVGAGNASGGSARSSGYAATFSRQGDTVKPLRPMREAVGAVAPSPAGQGREGGTFGQTSLVPGTRIEHERFGIGTVLGIEEAGDSAKARVQFENAGTKNLLLKFAKFRVLG